MARIKTYNQFINESLNIQLINEFVDPITLVFALGAIGIAFGSNIKAAYQKRKISKANLKELKLLLAKAEAKVKKSEKRGDSYHAEEAQEEVDNIKAHINSLSSEFDSYEQTIKDFESDEKTRKDLEEELKRLDNATLKRAINVANKEARGLK
jgi:hypothetical protein